MPDLWPPDSRHPLEIKKEASVVLPCDRIAGAVHIVRLEIVMEYGTRGMPHLYILTYIHTYIHTYIRTYIHTYIHACMHACIHTYVRTYVHKCMYIHKYIHT